MSRNVRIAATLLILASLTCGSLGALPSRPRITLVEHDRGGFLNAVLEWIASVFAPARPTGDTPNPSSPQTKDSSSLDPHGGR